MSRLASLAYKVEEDMNRHLVLPEWHPYTKQVTRVCDTLVKANSDIPLLSSTPWIVRVVYNDTINCVVFDSGEIIINIGMMDLMENDDQVAYVLAHELSHILLEHSGVIMSSSCLVDLLFFPLMTAIWAFIPKISLAFIVHHLARMMVSLTIKLPGLREAEMEADAVGLHLVAKACYDVREASKFLETFAKLGRKEE